MLNNDDKKMTTSRAVMHVPRTSWLNHAFARQNADTPISYVWRGRALWVSTWCFRSFVWSSLERELCGSIGVSSRWWVDYSLTLAFVCGNIQDPDDTHYFGQRNESQALVLQYLDVWPWGRLAALAFPPSSDRWWCTAEDVSSAVCLSWLYVELLVFE